MSVEIPFGKLAISAQLEAQLGPDAPHKVKLALARGLVPVPPAELLSALYVLACDADPEIRNAALQAAEDLPEKVLLQSISIRTHPKVLEFFSEFRPPSDALDERIGMLRTANDRTVLRIAGRAGPGVCELLSRNHERLLMTPEVYVRLHANAHCGDALLESAGSFLRMHRSMPAVPEVRPFLREVGQPETRQPVATPTAAPAPAAEDPRSGPLKMDLMAEIEAALRGDQSPAFVAAQKSDLDMFDLDKLASGPKAPGLADFSFDFTDDNEAFSWDLTADHDGTAAEDRGAIQQNLEQKIKDMSVGHKIKLAYLGNKETRSILLRDTNKMVAAAVVKSGRMTEQEVAACAGNKNLDSEVLREISSNSEFTRKYPVKVALVNNPKTPVSVAVGMVSSMQKKDLLMLTRNRNIPSVVSESALRLYRKKYRG